MYKTVKAHTKDARTVCCGPTLKDVERFRKNLSVNFMRDVLAYERTFMSEVIENHATSRLSNVDLNNHQCKHLCRFRCDREPSRIPIQSLKRLGNKRKKMTL